jgi:hypothetical protein
MLPIHNEDATLANMARNVLTCCAGQETLVPTETLRLLMGKLIERLEPRQTAAIEEGSEKTVRQFIARVQTAERDRDEGEAQKSDVALPKRTWS